MKEQYLPEGKLLGTEKNEQRIKDYPALRRAMLCEQVIEGMALRCDAEHNLIVQCGAYTGLIPRAECAIGIADGSTREVAILSRVGKPVSCLIEQIDAGLEHPLRLSRRSAQEAALAALLDDVRVHMVLPAVVTHLEPFGAFVDLGCGITSMIPIEHISISRISHPSDRFHVGQDIFVLVTGIDRTISRFCLSHKELLGTWSENARNFSVGETVTGYVRGVMDYGIFIELAPNLTGLSDVTGSVREGDRVSTYIKAIVPASHKIKLRIIESLPPLGTPTPLHYYITAGLLPDWCYTAS